MSDLPHRNPGEHMTTLLRGDLFTKPTEIPPPDPELLARVLDGLHQLPAGDAAPPQQGHRSHPKQE